MFRLFLVLFLCLSCTNNTKSTEGLSQNSDLSEEPVGEIYPLPELNTDKLSKTKRFVKQNAYSSNFAFFLDFNRRSGLRRFYVVDLNQDSIVNAGLVTHGHCQKYRMLKTVYSNVVGSNCSSLGKYKVKGKYDGSFGTAYKLFGLDSSNSNAFDRFIVLHGHSCVPDEQSAIGICKSEGCPTVSPSFLKVLENVIDNEEKPILMWIYE